MHRWLAVALAISAYQAHAGAFTEVDLFRNFAPSVAKIEFEGELFDGSRESSFGTAFLVSTEGLALTCNHVVPVETNYKSSTLKARFNSLSQNAVDGTVVWRDPDLDVALLSFGPRANAAPLVLSAVGAQSLLPGTSVMTLAFPIDLDLGVWSGKTNTKIPNDRRWVMDAVLNPGASGSPIFGTDGAIVGVAWGSAIRWKNGTANAPLEGIRLFVSADTIWPAIPEPQRSQLATAITVPQAVATESVVRVASTLDITQLAQPGDDGNHVFTIPFHARAGYQIVGVNSRVFNAANVSDYTVDVAPDGASAIARFVLNSGTEADPRRAWLKGTVVLDQKPLE